MSGIWHDIIPLLLAVAAIRYAAFAIPLVLAAASLARAVRVKDWASDVLFWIFIGLTVVAGIIAFSLFSEARRVCEEASRPPAGTPTLTELLERSRLQAQCANQ